ncbi:MAG: orotidine-5'-phosphate decarboxylase [Halothece sp.]
MLPQERLIVPLDVPDLESAIAQVEALPDVTFWKVGLELFVSAGPPILDYLKQHNKRIFLDLKFHDIPNTVAGACRAAIKYKVDLLTIHATVGKEALQAAVGTKQASTAPPKLLAITLLTSISDHALAFDLQVPIELSEYTLKMAMLAQESGLDGAVCSPQEVTKLREVCGDNFWLICPGVRPSFADNGDQKRVMTPKQALNAGADYLVIGRPITQSETPQITWQKICKEIME